MTRPGQPCPECNRRVPFPKTEKMPPTRRMGYWLPASEKDDHDAILEAAAEHLGTIGRPFFEWNTVTMGLALVLQDAALKDFAKK